MYIIFIPKLENLKNEEVFNTDLLDFVHYYGRRNIELSDSAKVLGCKLNGRVSLDEAKMWEEKYYQYVILYIEGDSTEQFCTLSFRRNEDILLTELLFASQHQE